MTSTTITTPLILLILVTFINFISFIISFILVRNLNKITERSFDLSVFFVLMISNFAYHLPAMVNIWEYNIFLFQAKFIIITFSLCWACVMSYMTHQAAIEACMPKSERYPNILWVGLGCFAFSFLWVILISTLHDTSLGVDLTFLVLILTIVIYYVRTVKFLRQATNPYITNITGKVMTWNLSMLTQAFFVGVGTIIQNTCFQVIVSTPEGESAGFGVFLGLILGGALSGMAGIINGILYKSGNKEGYFRRTTSLLGLPVRSDSIANLSQTGYSLM